MSSDCSKKIIVPNANIRDGILLSWSRKAEHAIDTYLYSQIRTAAINLGRKFHFEEKHALNVAKAAVQIFSALKQEHALDTREAMLLEIAAILHDIGRIINPSGHHKHGFYIIQNSEIFGLDGDDLKIVGNVVRYHRKSPPMPSHLSFVSLPRKERIVVMKLSAILRLAEALESSHGQQSTEFNVKRKGDEMILQTEGSEDTTHKWLRLKKKKAMFEEVFGLKIYLQKQVW